MKNVYLSAAAATFLLLMTGCVDDKYDLSNVDTTAEFKVQDLVLPVNLDEIKLKDILSLDDESNLKVINGEYVFTDNGTLTSDPVVVEPIDIAAPTINPLHEIITASSTGEVTTYPVESSWASFEYRSDNVSEYILDITRISTRLTMNINISIDELVNSRGSMTLTDLQIKLPGGLTLIPSMGSYNPTDGILTVPSATTHSGVLIITADVTEVNVPTEAASFDSATHSFVFSDRMRLVGGILSLNQSEYPDIPLGGQMNLTVKFSFSSLKAEKFSGKVYYTMSGFNINPINLSNLPDFLNQTGTDIVLRNPQIYMTANNPVGQFNLDAHAGLTLTPVRDEVPGTPLSIDNGTFIIPHSDGKGPYQFCISPTIPAKYPDGYTDSSHVPFSSLGHILSGSGLPQTINVDINDAGVSPSDVTDFVLGDLGTIAGNYMFYAPLALGANSVIRYADTKNGWNDETVDKLVINKLAIHALATNDTPFDVNLSGYPIQTGDKRIDNVDILGADLEKGARNQPVTIYITGTVTHLDGIVFTASLLSPDNADTLTPTDGITLSNVKVTVTGSYTDEL